jgi:hypothetical protein
MDHNFQQFEADLKAQGFDEVLARDWAPLTVVGTHVHSFAPKALVVRGEMWLTIGKHTQHIPTGGHLNSLPAHPTLNATATKAPRTGLAGAKSLAAHWP